MVPTGLGKLLVEAIEAEGLVLHVSGNDIMCHASLIDHTRWLPTIERNYHQIRSHLQQRQHEPN